MTETTAEPNLNTLLHDRPEWVSAEAALAAISGGWSWTRNSRCKYISLRIDTRNGRCVIIDRDGKQISLDQLQHQYGGGVA